MNNRLLARLATVLVVSIALPIIALAPAFLVSTFFTQLTADERESPPHATIDEHIDSEVVETVLTRSTLPDEGAGGDPSISGWVLLEDADVIRITIDEGRDTWTGPADVPKSGQLADPQWYTSDIIRKDVTIGEDFVRHGDILTFSYTHDPLMDKIMTDRNECSTVLRLRVEETDSRDPQRYVGYIKITGDDSVTMGRCSIPETDTDH